MSFWLTILWFDKLMEEGNRRIIIESFVSISREHVLSKLKARLWKRGKYKQLLPCAYQINHILPKVYIKRLMTYADGQLSNCCIYSITVSPYFVTLNSVKHSTLALNISKSNIPHLFHFKLFKLWTSIVFKNNFSNHRHFNKIGK